MFVSRQLHVHLLQQIDHIAEYLQHVNALRAQPGLGRLQLLTHRYHTFTQSLDLLPHISTDHRVALLPHHQVQVAASSQVQIVDAGQARGTA